MKSVNHWVFFTVDISGKRKQVPRLDTEPVLKNLFAKDGLLIII